MKLEKAYSIELDKVVSASEADNHYQNGEISSKFSFTCPGENCNAQVTCANLDKPVIKRIRSPYYLIVGECCDGCEINRAIEGENRRRGVGRNIYSESEGYIHDAVRLDVTPLSNKRSSGHIDLEGDGSYIVGGKSTSVDSRSKRKVQQKRRLSALVSAFRNKEYLKIQVPNEGVMPILDFFIDVRDKEIGDLDDGYRVYYGKAWVNKSDKGYSVRFRDTMKCNDIISNPSFFVPLRFLEESSFGDFNLRFMDDLANKKLKDVYILCEVAPYLVKKKYINFMLNGVDFFECRQPGAR